MSRPIAVIINDIHYNLNTLPLADAAMLQAINKANEFNLPLIVAGDLHDTKANIRGECIKAMIATFSQLNSRNAWVIRGNHDSIHEKTTEHSLEFLRPYAKVIHSSVLNLNLGDGRIFNLLSYHNDSDQLKDTLKKLDKNIITIMHQGLQGSNSGDYIQDKSAITKQDVAGMRVISGHYHQRQDIELPDGGLWTYTGNPYTLNFGEASHSPKGFHILMDDGTLEFVPTNLRRHIIIPITYEILNRKDTIWDKIVVKKDDILMVKISGDREKLSFLTKEKVGILLNQEGDFKLDLIPTDTKTKAPAQLPKTQHELLDNLIDSSNTSDDVKSRLKQMWRRLV